MKLSEERVVSTRIGLDLNCKDCRQIVIDFDGPKLDAVPENKPPVAIANCSTNAAIVDNQVIRNEDLGTLARDFENAAQARQRGPGGSALHAATGHEYFERDLDLSMESAVNPAILPDESGQLAGRPLEEWNAAYAKVESYFHALRIRNKPLLGQLVLRVLERAQRRAPAEPARSATLLAAEEMDRIVTEWFSEVLQVSPTNTDQTLSTRGRLALLLADMPGKWQDQFLRPGPWPEEFTSAMRETFFRAGPDFQLSKMTPRPLDLGPITTLTNLGRLPYFRMALAWTLFALLLIAIFWLTHAGSSKPGPGCSTSLTGSSKMADAPNISAAAAPRLQRGWRVFIFYSCALLLTGLVSLLFADLLWRTGWSASRTVLLVLFVILFLFAAIGCVHGVFGFFLRTFGDERRITNLANFRDQNIDGISTAIVFPIYNENVVRVYEGLRATYESLAKAGQLDHFDFFILSDSTNPDKWIEEERRWYDLIRELDALGKIYYRRRLVNEARKSGNVRDFLNTWGRRYRYFICCDADSVMRGETLVSLVKLMESHPAAGMIQTVPALVNAESLFGRIQQFANRLYAPIFIAGLNYWALDLGNYWGHNAIIRTEPFMQCCDLPQLPGHKPFGGQILSHDFVEAALLLRENWEVAALHERLGADDGVVALWTAYIDTHFFFTEMKIGA